QRFHGGQTLLLEFDRVLDLLLRILGGLLDTLAVPDLVAVRFDALEQRGQFGRGLPDQIALVVGLECNGCHLSSLRYCATIRVRYWSYVIRAMPTLAGRMVAVPPVPPAVEQSTGNEKVGGLILVTTRLPFGSALAPVTPAMVTESPVWKLWPAVTVNTV